MTLQEAFSSLPKTIAAKAIANLQNVPETLKEHTFTLESKCCGLKDAIASFKWSKSEGNKEGTEYWWNQYLKAKS
jgi:hypothetical protein